MVCLNDLQWMNVRRCYLAGAKLENICMAFNIPIGNKQYIADRVYKEKVEAHKLEKRVYPSRFRLVYNAIDMSGKQEPYHHNEWSYAKIPNYHPDTFEGAELEILNSL